MTTITKTFKTQTGKTVDLTLDIEQAEVSGTATIAGVDYSVNGYAVVKGRKCLKINAAAPYLPIDNSLYNQIHSVCKQQFAASMSERQILEGKVDAARIKYQRLFDAGTNNVATIQARDEWERLSRELRSMA